MLKEMEWIFERLSTSGNRTRFLVGWSVEGSAGLIQEPWQEEILK
jgi:hypothetical protein